MIEENYKVWIVYHLYPFPGSFFYLWDLVGATLNQEVPIFILTRNKITSQKKKTFTLNSKH